MAEFVKKALFVVAVMAGLVVSFLIGSHYPLFSRFEPIKEKTDTLIVHDTIASYNAVSISLSVVDSLLVPVTDFVIIDDTILMLPLEQIVWEDSLSRIYASGYHPQIDSVFHFQQTTIIEKETIVKRNARWGLGIQAGLGAGKDGLTPFVGVGVSYNFLTW